MGCASSAPTFKPAAEPAAVGQLVSTPSTLNSGHPAARVRATFRKLDTDKSGKLSLEELTSGLEQDICGEGGTLPPHAKEAITTLFEAHAKEYPGTLMSYKALPSGSFARFYAEILFRKFDANNNGTLQLDEAQEALKFLKPKSGTDGSRADVHVAFPQSAYVDGELRLPWSWFWAMFLAME